MVEQQEINSSELAEPAGPYSHVVNAGANLYMSGQVAQDPATGKVIDGDVTAQTTLVIEILRTVLKTVGRDLGHVVKVNVFLTDMADYAEMNAVYARHFSSPYPARSTVAVKALPLGARVEMECVAL